MCMHSVLLGGEEQRLLLEKAEELGMVDGTYVFIPYDALTYSMPYQKESYTMLSDNLKLRMAYDAVLTITMDSPERSFREAFREAQQKGEIPGHLSAEQVPHLQSGQSCWGEAGPGGAKRGEGPVCLVCTHSCE